MSDEKTVGLLLQTVPYLAGRRIVKVLTSESGLLSFLAPRKISPALTTPFVWAEWVFAKDHREIQRLKDATLLDDLAALKQDYPRLAAAGQIARDLLRSQMPGKPAAELLALALACLRKLPLFIHPHLLAASFRLKLLSHEGLLHPVDLSSPLLQTLAFSRSFHELSNVAPEEADLRKIDLLIEERLDFPRK